MASFVSAGKGQKGRGEEGIRGLDGWMASPTQWTRTWAIFRRLWGTGTSAVLQFMGSPRVGHDWVTDNSNHSFLLGRLGFTPPVFVEYQPCALYVYTHIYVLAQLLQSCPTFCSLMDCNLPGFSLHETLQGRILEWVAMSSSKRSS